MTLTARQRTALQAVHSLTVSQGYPPTVREVAAAVGNASPSGTKWLLDRLEEGGYLTRTTSPRTMVLTEAGRDVLAYPDGR